VKTTVEIDDVLLRCAKQVALDRGTTLRTIIEQTLRRELAASRRKKPLKLVTVPGGVPEGFASRETMWAWLDAHPGDQRE
jgi:hypothetical protein